MTYQKLSKYIKRNFEIIPEHFGTVATSVFETTHPTHSSIHWPTAGSPQRCAAESPDPAQPQCHWAPPSLTVEVGRRLIRDGWFETEKKCGCQKSPKNNMFLSFSHVFTGARNSKKSKASTPPPTWRENSRTCTSAPCGCQF